MHSNGTKPGEIIIFSKYQVVHVNIQYDPLRHTSRVNARKVPNLRHNTQTHF